MCSSVLIIILRGKCTCIISVKIILYIFSNQTASTRSTIPNKGTQLFDPFQTSSDNHQSQKHNNKPLPSNRKGGQKHHQSPQRDKVQKYTMYKMLLVIDQ